MTNTQETHPTVMNPPVSAAEGTEAGNQYAHTKDGAGCQVNGVAPHGGAEARPARALSSFERKLLRSMDDAEHKAWDALSKYKFWMFGYHAGAWVRDNRCGEFKKPNPFKILVQVAKAILVGGTVTITMPPIAPSRRPNHQS